MQGLCTIYGTRALPCAAADVAAAASPAAAIETLAGDGPASARFAVGLEGGRVVLSVIDAEAPALRRQVEALTHLVLGATGDEVDARGYEVVRQAAGAWQVVGVAWDGPSEAPAAVTPLVEAVAQRLLGLVLRDGRLLDPAGRALLGEGPGARDAQACVPLADDACPRKARSEERLASAGVAVNPRLPAMAGEPQVRLRAADEVARRAQALWAVAARADGIERYDAIDLLLRRGLWDAATPAEQEFLRGEEAPREVRLRWRRRAEALRTLLWALGHEAELGGLDAAGSLEDMTRTLRAIPAEAFVRDAALRRTAGEVLDAADLVYRAHWAIADAASRGAELPPGLHPAVVAQRHTALLWLLQHMKQPWTALAAEDSSASAPRAP